MLDTLCNQAMTNTIRDQIKNKIQALCCYLEVAETQICKTELVVQDTVKQIQQLRERVVLSTDDPSLIGMYGRDDDSGCFDYCQNICYQAIQSAQTVVHRMPQHYLFATRRCYYDAHYSRSNIVDTVKPRPSHVIAVLCVITMRSLPEASSCPSLREGNAP